MFRKYYFGLFLILNIVCNGVSSSDISFANKALQEFLKNYDQIQKILTSKDGSQNNSTSSDNDDNTNVSLYKQSVKQKNLLFKQIRNTSATLRPGTAGIYESDSLDDEAISFKEITNQATNKAKRPIIDDTDRNSEYSESEDIEEIPIEMPAKTDVIITKQNKNIIKYDKKVRESDKPKVFQNILGEKTRFSIQHFRSNSSQNDNINFKVPIKIEENSRRIKKIIYSETFSPKNIWQEIISRPIKLNKEKDVYFRNDRSRSKNNDKITIVILTRKEMGDNNSTEDVTQLLMDREPKSLNRTKLEFLRKTYGDTCLQIPIKKCNKAIKAVNKLVCKVRFKCKSELKSSFIDNGKEGCKKKFMYKEKKLDDEKDESKIQPLEFRYSKHNDSFIDATRGRFFDKNYLRKNTDIFNRISIRNDTPESVIQPKPLSLRDKYERECKKENRKKCISACDYATEKTCSEHSCVNNINKAFKKSCKEECNKLFIVDKDSTSDSSDSDSTDSDGSDSLSDSDSN